MKSLITILLILLAGVAVGQRNGQTLLYSDTLAISLGQEKMWLSIDTNTTVHLSRDGGFKAIMLDRDTIWSKWWESIPSEPSDGMAVTEIDTNGTVYRPITIDDLLRYRKACYDDSTLTTSTWEWDSAASAKGYFTVMKKVRDNYVHWRTPSLPGFIDWLEKARNR